MRFKIIKLEELVEDLRSRLKRAEKGGAHKGSEESGMLENVELEVRLNNAEHRNDALQS